MQSWSDGAVVALVATGSTSGNARVLQNGVMSNAVAFTVNTLQIASVTPASGAPGTSVTTTGAGFGSSQGSGIVWLGSTAGQVTSWSDTAVVATVASGAVSGIARIEQNGVWSNAVTFTVPVSGGNSVTLSPNLLTMLVGDTHTIQALNSSGQPVTGLTWASSDPTVVSLSTDDPPLLTALAVGHVTITAGTGSADVTVSAVAPGLPGGLPLGTVLWSVTGNVAQIVPAVPSPSGVADVFAFSYDGMGGATVQAITSDGTVAWTADVSQRWSQPVPDFQGGLVVPMYNSIVKLDGITGQPYSAYTPDGFNSLDGPVVAVHTDGTIFTIQQNWEGDTGYSSVIGIDPTTGTQKFSVPIESSSTYWFEPEGLMIAGDGYAYVPYEYRDDGPGCEVIHLGLLRVNSSGAYDDMKILDWPSESCEWDFLPVGMITNADQGIVLTWAGTTETSQANGPVASGMAITTGASASLIGMPLAPGQGSAIAPVLQAQDGSFVGTIQVWQDANGNPLTNMIAFDQAGNVRWTVPGNYQPQIATADGGLIATDPSGAAVTFDQYGNATGVLAGSPVQSWTGNTYEQAGSLESVVAPMVFEDGASFWPAAGGNPSGNGTSILQCPCLLQSAGTLEPNLSVAKPRSSALFDRLASKPLSDSSKTYLLMAGDPGLNLGPGHEWNVGSLFNLASETQAMNLTQSGSNTVITQRVSSFSDFSAALTTNGLIDGDITYFGHGGLDHHGNPALFPGQAYGDAYNVSVLNVGQLSSANLGSNVTITLNACHAGLGGRRSIAQLIAKQLNRPVFAYPVDMYFSSDPTPRAFTKGMQAPTGVPTYMVPNGNGIQPIQFPLR